MKFVIISALLLFSISAANAQIPSFTSNTTTQQRDSSLVYQTFKGKYDFLISFTAESYWWGNLRQYNLLGYKNGQWQKIYYITKRKKSGKWEKPSIRFKNFDSSWADSLLDFWGKEKFWTLNSDSLNINERAIPGTTKIQKFLVSDSPNYRFEIIQKDQYLSIESYAPDYYLEKMPEIKCRATFIKCREKFVRLFAEEK